MLKVFISLTDCCLTLSYFFSSLSVLPIFLFFAKILVFLVVCSVPSVCFVMEVLLSLLILTVCVGGHNSVYFFHSGWYTIGQYDIKYNFLHDIWYRLHTWPSKCFWLHVIIGIMLWQEFLVYCVTTIVILLKKEIVD